MSRIAKRVNAIPAEIKITIEKDRLIIEGKLGKDELYINPNVKIICEKNNILAQSENLALAGTFNSLIYNMIKGVTEGYQKILEIKGVGYKVVKEDNKLGFDLGKSHRANLDHHDYVDIPSELKVVIEGSKKIIISGINKQKVSSFAKNNIRRLREPSVYKKNKGIYLKEEENDIKIKASKSLHK
jgi:large subunit ribosomal protein L6